MVSRAEGEVFIGDTAVEESQATFPEVKENAILRTQRGRAEVLLTRGVYMRVGESASFKMLTNVMRAFYVPPPPSSTMPNGGYGGGNNFPSMGNTSGGYSGTMTSSATSSVSSAPAAAASTGTTAGSSAGTSSAGHGASGGHGK
jgi:hypothetical protein